MGGLFQADWQIDSMKITSLQITHLSLRGISKCWQMSSKNFLKKILEQYIPHHSSEFCCINLIYSVLQHHCYFVCHAHLVSRLHAICQSEEVNFCINHFLLVFGKHPSRLRDEISQLLRVTIVEVGFFIKFLCLWTAA